MSTISTWAASSSLPRFPKLAEDLTADVVVIGGGFTGVSTAALLKRAGLKVVLLERDRCGDGDTLQTTAHLTCVTDPRLSELVDRFGKEVARATWEAGWAAIAQIESLVSESRISCGFGRVPGFLHAPVRAASADEAERLRRDADLATELGFDAAFIESAPVIGTSGVRFADQAKVHPLDYVAGLLQSLPGDGCRVFEESEVTEVSDTPLAVTANGHRVSCGFVVVATHVPIMGKAGMASAMLLQSKLMSYTSYALGAELPTGSVPEALFWDTADPYTYVRVDRRADHDYVIYGGADHKTGQEPETAHFQTLEGSLRSYWPQAKVDARWSGQVVETVDGLPYIGETAKRQFVATGFAGNGLTFGTVAAMMACNLVQGIENPWTALFSPQRTSVQGTWESVKENVDYPYYLARDLLAGTEGKALDQIDPGRGKILKLDGKKVAAYRAKDGSFTTLSPVCTHMGCSVRWNNAESTWDCPCHGSRFQPTGEVLAGPAETPLERVDAPTE